MTDKIVTVTNKGTIHSETEKNERVIQVGTSRVSILKDTIKLEAEHVIVNGVEVK